MSKPKIIDPNKVIGWKCPPSEQTFSEKDAILYALGLGFSQDPLKQSDFKYTYELDDNFTVFPIMATVIPKMNIISYLLQNEYMPEFNPAMLLHAQQRVQFYVEKLIPEMVYVTEGELVDVADKGKIALFTFVMSTYQKLENSRKLAVVAQSTLAIKGLASFGFKGKKVAKVIPSLPKTAEDVTIQAHSYPNQAFIYRLSGDWNPLHVDPNFAAMQKFKQPILHGLATKGIIAKAIIQQLLNGQASRLKSFHCRFVGHVFPGESFRIKIWKINDLKAVYQVSVQERGTNVLIGSYEVRQSARL